MSCGSIYHLKQRIDDLERQLAEAQRILDLDDSRLLTAVENTARALKQRDEAQKKLDAMLAWSGKLATGHPTGTWQGLVKDEFARILKGE